ncbi:IQ calmodulin-binding motif-containing protein 1-like isoform X2 [Thalassophryne amazonica]|uniref:IQ calmodulin-binding motif-containing protein 1-like isoform X2 n=1 Tax=Thalassophryne amazonica TaxID=390379 RepID=UPI001471A652|nr:IQ calmodulin-binding motif-containing protein 1-like isoform X2 [Thalassophryne amazonica]
MDPVDPKVLVSELKQQLEDEVISPDQRVGVLTSGLNNALNVVALVTDSDRVTLLKSELYLSGVLSHCVHALSLDPRRLQGGWSTVASLAQLTSSCCVGVQLGEHSEVFLGVFLPSVMDSLLSLATRLMRHTEGLSVFGTLMDSVGWLLSAHKHLSTQVLTSVDYEQLQMCDDVTVPLMCLQMWIQTCKENRDFLSGLSNNTVMLLLNEAIGQLTVSGDHAVGGASVKLILLMANQLGRRLHRLVVSFRGLVNFLDKDCRGQGFDQDVNQLIALIHSDSTVRDHAKDHAARVQAACVIQAVWRSYRTRLRVKRLSRGVRALQTKFQAQRKLKVQQEEAQRSEEELKYQVCLRRHQARRKFHQKQRELLQLLPADQVEPYLQECRWRAAVVIQSAWRGFRQRRHYNTTQRITLQHRHLQEHAARILQTAVRRFLERCRAAKAPPLAAFWIGQKGLTDSRRVALKRQVEEHVSVHPSSCVSPEECERHHQATQLLLLSLLQRGAEHRRAEQRMEVLLAHVHTQLERLRDAPPLSAITPTDAESFLSPSGAIAARARDAHNAVLQASRRPWWTMLDETESGDLCDSAHLEELEVAFGGLYVGGAAGRPKWAT